MKVMDHGERIRLELDAMRAFSRLLRFYEEDCERMQSLKSWLEMRALRRQYGTSMANVILSAFTNHDAIRSIASTYGASGMTSSDDLEQGMIQYRSHTIMRLSVLAAALRSSFLFRFLIVRHWLSTFDYLEGNATRLRHVLSFLRFRILERVFGSGRALLTSLSSVTIAVVVIVVIVVVPIRVPVPVPVPVVAKEALPPDSGGQPKPLGPQEPPGFQEPVEAPTLMDSDEVYVYVLEAVASEIPRCLRMDGGRACNRVRRFCGIGGPKTSGPVPPATGGVVASPPPPMEHEQVQLVPELRDYSPPIGLVIAPHTTKVPFQAPPGLSTTADKILAMGTVVASDRAQLIPRGLPLDAKIKESTGIRIRQQCYTVQEVRSLCSDCEFPQDSPFRLPEAE